MCARYAALPIVRDLDGRHTVGIVQRRTARKRVERYAASSFRFAASRKDGGRVGPNYHVEDAVAVEGTQGDGVCAAGELCGADADKVPAKKITVLPLSSGSARLARGYELDGPSADEERLSLRLPHT